MKHKTYIEKAVAEHFQVSKEDLYDTSKRAYPFSAAHSVLMYLLYASREYKIYEIQKMFGYNARRTVEYRIASVASSVKKDVGKLAEDVKAIKEKLNEKIK